MTIALELVAPEETELLDIIDLFARENFTEELRCCPSTAELVPLYPDRSRLGRLAERDHLLVGREDGDIVGYCSIDKDTGLIRWLVCTYAAVGEATAAFCAHALSAWSLHGHGRVENPSVRSALLLQENLEDVNGEIAWTG